MIEALRYIIESDHFKICLNNPKLWSTLDIDYHPPRVERVWMPWSEGRLSLHIIHPCDENDALLHPHPWDSAVYVLPHGGKYEHGIGYRREYETEIFGESVLMEEDIIICKQIVTGQIWYEMLEERGIHYVRPIGLPVYTIMYSGPVIYKGNHIKADIKLESLSEKRKEQILSIFNSLLK